MAVTRRIAYTFYKVMHIAGSFSFNVLLVCAFTYMQRKIALIQRSHIHGVLCKRMLVIKTKSVQM